MSDDKMMVWYDGDVLKPLTQKLDGGAAHFRKTRQVEPNVCFVDPVTALTAPAKHAGMEIRRARTLLAGHFWFAREE